MGEWDPMAPFLTTPTAPMFAVIRSNQRKSVALILLLGLTLILAGAAFGALLDPTLGVVGAAGALGLWVILLAVSFSGGEALLLHQAGARELRRLENPRLFNLVEEMQIAAGLSQPPRIFLIDSASANAFAVGRNERRAAVAVTTGLLARLNRDELQGVIAHEIAHIHNRDTLFMTLAGTSMGAIIMLADFYVRGLRRTSMRSRRSSGRGGQGAALLALAAVVLAILAPLLAQLLYFACSRRREYLADACAAQFTRYPEGLASALEKLAAQPPAGEPASRVLAPMYIAPSAAHGASGLFSTHPPTTDRVRVLRAMSGGSSLKAYEDAYRKLHGNRSVVGADVAASREEGVRAPTSTEPPSLAPAWREARGILHTSDGLRAVDCTCGVRLRIPPGLAPSPILCPRCGKMLDGAGIAAIPPLRSTRSC